MGRGYVFTLVFLWTGYLKKVIPLICVTVCTSKPWGTSKGLLCSFLIGCTWALSALFSMFSLLSQEQKAIILISNCGNSYSFTDEKLFLFYPACSIISPTRPCFTCWACVGVVYFLRISLLYFLPYVHVCIVLKILFCVVNQCGNWILFHHTCNHNIFLTLYFIALIHFGNLIPNLSYSMKWIAHWKEYLMNCLMLMFFILCFPTLAKLIFVFCWWSSISEPLTEC